MKKWAGQSGPRGTYVRLEGGKALYERGPKGTRLTLGTGKVLKGGRATRVQNTLFRKEYEEDAHA